MSVDEWKDIFVIYNGNAKAISYVLEGEWTVACENGKIDQNGIRKVADTIEVPAILATIFLSIAYETIVYIYERQGL